MGLTETTPSKRTPFCAAKTAIKAKKRPLSVQDQPQPEFALCNQALGQGRNGEGLEANLEKLSRSLRMTGRHNYRNACKLEIQPCWRMIPALGEEA
jgi:hypothetical protein